MSQSAEYWSEYVTRPGVHARRMQLQRDRIAANREMLREIKLTRGCIDCGYNARPEALDFDHVRGEKRWSLARSFNRSRAQLLEEAAKCDVRCANCHRVRTAERRG